MKFRLAIAGLMILAAMLACNLPGSTPPEATPTEDLPLLQPTDTQMPPEAPTDTPAAEPTTETATDTPGDTASCTPDANFVADVTIPDGTLVEPGETITKTWRIRNSGTCTWDSSYTWEQLNFGETKLNAAAESTPLTGEIAPGQTYDLSVSLTLAADAAVGSSQVARFQMRSGAGDLFGTHPFASIFAAVGTGVCPVGNANQATFINVSEHYCFLYNVDNDAYVGATGSSVVRAPGTPGVNEEILASVSISSEGSTSGQSLNQWTAQMVNDWKAPATTPTVTDVQVGEMPAKQTDDLPGQVGNRIVFLVEDGNGYVFTVLPVDDSFSDKTNEALDIWELVRTSFTFFQP